MVIDALPLTSPPTFPPSSHTHKHTYTHACTCTHTHTHTHTHTYTHTSPSPSAKWVLFKWTCALALIAKMAKRPRKRPDWQLFQAEIVSNKEKWVKSTFIRGVFCVFVWLFILFYLFFADWNKLNAFSEWSFTFTLVCNIVKYHQFTSTVIYSHLDLPHWNAHTNTKSRSMHSVSASTTPRKPFKSYENAWPVMWTVVLLCQIKEYRHPPRFQEWCMWNIWFRGISAHFRGFWKISVDFRRKITIGYVRGRKLKG